MAAGGFKEMADEGYVVRIRGLPWSCSVEEVSRFFSGKAEKTDFKSMYLGCRQMCVCVLQTVMCVCVRFTDLIYFFILFCRL